jgi:hypothetical protein
VPRCAPRWHQAIDSLLEDARLAPCLAEAAFHNAVLTLALAGVEALQAKDAQPQVPSHQLKSPIKPERPHAQHVHHH